MSAGYSNVPKEASIDACKHQKGSFVGLGLRPRLASGCLSVSTAACAVRAVIESAHTSFC